MNSFVLSLLRQAANGTLAFQPQQVTPYHYRNADATLSNTTQFAELVAAGAARTQANVTVRLLDFYPHGPIGLGCRGH